MSHRWLRVVIGAIAMVAGLAWSGAAKAQLPLMSVTASPGSLTITTAVAGSSPTGVTEATTKYSTNTLAALGTSKITAQLSSAMPEGATLTITLAAQSGATSMGEVTLSTTAQALVMDIPTLSTASNLAITYRLSATSAAGVIALSPHIVLFFIGSQ